MTSSSSSTPSNAANITATQLLGGKQLMLISRAVSRKSKLSARARIATIRDCLEVVRCSDFQGWGDTPEEHEAVMAHFKRYCDLAEDVIESVSLEDATRKVVEAAPHTYNPEHSISSKRNQKYGYKLIQHCLHHVIEMRVNTLVRKGLAQK